MKNTILILLSILYISNSSADSEINVNVHKKLENITLGMLSSVYNGNYTSYTELSPYVRYEVNKNITVGYRMIGISNQVVKKNQTVFNTDNADHSISVDVAL